MAMSMDISATSVLPLPRRLQQTVHLLSRAHVFPYFLNDTFLCACERKRKVVEVKVVERLADTAEYIAAIFAPVVAGVSQNVELNIEKLFELQTVAGLAHVVGRFGGCVFFLNASSLDIMFSGLVMKSGRFP